MLEIEPPDDEPEQRTAKVSNGDVFVHPVLKAIPSFERDKDGGDQPLFSGIMGQCT